jgi:uracil-DNA glycosylase
MMVTRKEVLDKIFSIWDDCKACELCYNRQQVVFWRGDHNAKLVLIGEAPGADEDEQGDPFVGKAGRELNRLLELAGLDVEKDIFISNIVGCRPPGNRKPTLTEMKACRPRLDAILWAIQPRALLLMGATAASLAGIREITKWRGSKSKVEIDLLKSKITTYNAIATFHPSYLLRSGGDAKIEHQMVGDIKKAWSLATSEKR